jgi:3',5'-cyclic AMP phosphodiesterase CpdA
VHSLLHLSDVHFGPKHLVEPARAVLDLARTELPEVVVVSGDLTQRAKPAQFREARAFVDALAAPVVWVPGNHDVPLWRIWERIFAPFGAWRRSFDPELVRDYRGKGLAVVGVNTAHGWTTKHGRLRPADLADLEARLDRLPAGGARVLVAHHPVASGPELEGEPVARRSSRLLDVARRHGVDLVLSGHLHRSFALSAPGPVGRPGPVVVHCGTTLSSRGRGVERGRNSLFRIDIHGAELEVEKRFWNPEAGLFEAVERWRFPRPASQREPEGR